VRRRFLFGFGECGLVRFSDLVSSGVCAREARGRFGRGRRSRGTRTATRSCGASRTPTSATPTVRASAASRLWLVACRFCLDCSLHSDSHNHVCRLRNLLRAIMLKCSVLARGRGRTRWDLGDSSNRKCLELSHVAITTSLLLDLRMVSRKRF
jgi:hypothetical protein